MAKMNTLRLATVVAAAVAAAVLLLGVEKSAVADAKAWNSVTKVTGTMTFKYDLERKLDHGGFDSEHDTITWHPTFTDTGGTWPHWISNDPAKVTVKEEILHNNPDGTPADHHRWTGNPTANFTGGMQTSTGTSWTSIPDDQTHSGDYFWMNPGPVGAVPVTVEDLLTGQTRTVDFHDKLHLYVA